MAPKANPFDETTNPYSGGPYPAQPPVVPHAPGFPVSGSPIPPPPMVDPLAGLHTLQEELFDTALRTPLTHDQTRAKVQGTAELRSRIQSARTKFGESPVVMGQERRSAVVSAVISFSNVLAEMEALGELAREIGISLAEIPTMKQKTIVAKYLLQEDKE